MKLANKVAWITGGNSGIGFATARLFVNEGARVAITGRNPKTLQQAADELGQNVLALQADAADVEATQRAVDRITKEFGNLDVVFANAGFADDADGYLFRTARRKTGQLTTNPLFQRDAHPIIRQVNNNSARSRVPGTVAISDDEHKTRKLCHSHVRPGPLRPFSAKCKSMNSTSCLGENGFRSSSFFLAIDAT
jgi:nucleoside-diphosphate-sugar epimerase